MLIYKITKSDGYRLCQSAGHEAISHFNVGFKIIWVQVTSTLVLLNGRLLLFPFSSLPFNVNMWYHWDLCAVVRQIYRRESAVSNGIRYMLYHSQNRFVLFIYLYCA